MSLVFAGIVPHSPLLMPTIGKEYAAQLAKTKAALEQLEKELYVAQPETILVLTPHGGTIADALSLNLNGKYVSDFAEFGDLATKHSWKSEIMLADHIREDFKGKGLPLVMCSEEHLDYGSAVPLSYLTAHLPDIRIIPIMTSQLDMKTHFGCGKELKDEIMRATKRVAVIASADLSPRAAEGSPAGFSPRGAAFDDKVVETFSKNAPIGMLDIDEQWVAEAQACGAKPLATFAGLLDELKHETAVLSYEKPLGVGYLVAHVKIA